MTFLTIILSAITFIICIPIIFITIEIFASFLSDRHAALLPANRRSPNDPDIINGHIFVVVPAHNEGENMRPTLRDISRQLRPQDKLIVVADNCTDTTADIAREEGAICIERHNLEQRGKGYAIEFALNHIQENYKAQKQSPDQPDGQHDGLAQSDRPEILILIDADSRLTEDLLSNLASASHKTQRPVQALYLMNPPKTITSDSELIEDDIDKDSQQSQNLQIPDLRVRVSAFAWLLINQVRMSGLGNLFDTTRLTGSGMAFPWTIIQSTFKGSGNIVEDLAFTLALTVKGHSPILLKEAKIFGTFPSSQEGAATQRARWELGSLAIARKKIFSLLAQGIKERNLKIIAAALDISIPPLVMLIFSSILLLLISALIALLFGVVTPFKIVAFSFFWMCIALFLSWFFYGRTILPPSALPGIFAFLLEKLKVYGAKGRQSAQTWTRTKRD